MDSDLAGFVGLAALMVALVTWLRADMKGRMDRFDERLDRLETVQAERFSRVEAMQTEQGERLAHIEATLSEHGERLTRTVNA